MWVIFIWSRMNLGGVTGRKTTWDSWYEGFSGSLYFLFELNLTHWGVAPAMSYVFKFVSCLFRPTCRARGIDLSMSQFLFVNSCLFGFLDPWSFGTAPKYTHNTDKTYCLETLIWMIGIFWKSARDLKDNRYKKRGDEKEHTLNVVGCEIRTGSSDGVELTHVSFATV